MSPRVYIPVVAGAVILPFGALAARQTIPADQARYTVVNLVDPMPGYEADMAAYLQKHGRRFARYSGVVSFRLFQAVGEKGAAPVSPYRFMQVYELDRPREEAAPPPGIEPETPRPPSRASITYVYAPISARITHLDKPGHSGQWAACRSNKLAHRSVVCGPRANIG